MKHLLFIFFIAINTAKAQSVYIYASQKIKGAEIPIERVDFDVFINDSLKKKFTSGNDGALGRISLEKGKYKIKISTLEYADGLNNEVIINESKTTNLVLNLIPLTAAQVEEKKKENKK